MKTKGGHAAFPVPVGPDNALSDCEGMSLRDYFAAAALQGIAVRYPHTGTAVMIADAAYILADAMLAQRDVIDPSFEVKE